jgi:hypothetical protein
MIQETVAVEKPPLQAHLELCLSQLHHFPPHLVKVFPVFDGGDRFDPGAGSETFLGLELAGDLDLTSIEQKLQQLLHPNNQPAVLSGFQSVLLARRRRMLEKLHIIVNGIDDDDGELKVPIVPFVEPPYGPDSCCLVVPLAEDRLKSWALEQLVDDIGAIAEGRKRQRCLQCIITRRDTGEGMADAILFGCIDAPGERSRERRVVAKAIRQLRSEQGGRDGLRPQPAISTSAA